MSRHVCSTFVVCTLIAATCMTGFGQSTLSASEPSTSVQPGPAQPGPATTPSVNGSDSRNFGISVKASLLGAGAEAAVRVSRRSNVRAGFNMFSYSRGFNKDGIAYDGQLGFKTVEAHYDFFPWAKSFHISPGVLAYLGNPITASASVPQNQNFSLGGVQYYSDPANPTTGNGKINFNRAAPMITMGWGNLISRKEGHHFTVPFELGLAYQGTPKATLNLAGNVCDSPGVNCRSAATDAGVQNNLLSEQTKIDNSMSFFKVYPIISIGVGYKF